MLQVTVQSYPETYFEFILQHCRAELGPHVLKYLSLSPPLCPLSFQSSIYSVLLFPKPVDPEFQSPLLPLVGRIRE